MARLLPAIYSAVILIEFTYLTWRYATDPPPSSSGFSVGLGWGALISMIIMLIYSVARRSKALREIARLSSWLHFHIYLGVQGAMLAIFHSLHLFMRSAPAHLLNPAVLNLIAVIVVFGSGIFGRYLYSFVPRSLSGELLAAKGIDEELKRLSQPLPSEIEGLWKNVPKATSLFGLVRADLATRSALRRVHASALASATKDLAVARVRLERRVVQLAYATKLFQRWIVLHRPIATIMYVLSIVHVALSYMYTPSLGAG
jgi:hypothetical protein